MKSQLTFLLILLTVSTSPILAQTTEKPDPKSKEYLLTFAEKVDHNWIWFKKGSNIAAKTFFQVYAPNLGLGEFDEMRLKRTWEAFGIKYYAYQQYYKQIEVEQAEYILHEDKEGHLEVARGYIASNLNLPSAPILREDDALNRILNPKIKYAWQDPKWEEQIKKQEKSDKATFKPKARLLYLNIAPYREYATFDQLELAYIFDVPSVEPFENRRIAVSATSGEKLSDFSTMQNHGKPKSIDGKKLATPTIKSNLFFPDTPINFVPYYSARYGSTNTFTGKQEYAIGSGGDITLGFSLKDEARNIIGVRDADPQYYTPVLRAFPFSETLGGVNWGSYDQGITMGFWSAQKSYDFYKYTFSRNGMSGSNNATAVIGEAASQQNNAGYNQWGGYDFMIFGDGFMGPTSTLDVTGHEFTHGVIRYTSNLGQTHLPGAINEGFADVMSICIEKYTTGYNNWVIGEDWFPGGLRSFSNPNITGNPAVVGDGFWFNPDGCVPIDAVNDRCGIHRNSTIISRWFGMVATSFVGFDDARTVAYHTMIGLPSNANLMDVRNLSAQVARNMTFFPCGSIEDMVLLKWSEVGVGTGGCGGGGRVASAEVQSETLEEMIVYPNPAKDHVRITIGEKHAGNQSKEFTLYNSNGLKISERVTSGNSEVFQLNNVQDKVIIAKITTTSATGASVVLQKRIALNR